ncbi:MAG: hypothetical protein WBL68_00930 [Nitrososphaeraceae archaeon]
MVSCVLKFLPLNGRRQVAQQQPAVASQQGSKAARQIDNKSEALY